MLVQNLRCLYAFLSSGAPGSRSSILAGPSLPPTYGPSSNAHLVSQTPLVFECTLVRTQSYISICPDPRPPFLGQALLSREQDQQISPFLNIDSASQALKGIHSPATLSQGKDCLCIAADDDYSRIETQKHDLYIVSLLVYICRLSYRAGIICYTSSFQNIIMTVTNALP